MESFFFSSATSYSNCVILSHFLLALTLVSMPPNCHRLLCLAVWFYIFSHVFMYTFQSRPDLGGRSVASPPPGWEREGALIPLSTSKDRWGPRAAVGSVRKPHGPGFVPGGLFRNLFLGPEVI